MAFLQFSDTSHWPIPANPNSKNPNFKPVHLTGGPGLQPQLESSSSSSSSKFTSGFTYAWQSSAARDVKDSKLAIRGKVVFLGLAPVGEPVVEKNLHYPFSLNF